MTGTDVVHAAAAGAKSLSDLLNQRSPGERTAAQLTKTKHARALAKKHFVAAPPTKLAIAPPVSGKSDFGDIAQLLVASPPPAVDIAPPMSEIAINSPTVGGIIGSLPGGDIGTPGGGGGLVSFPASEPHSPIPVAAVPEPGTWATMLLGFGLLGWRLRRGTKRLAIKAVA